MLSGVLFRQAINTLKAVATTLRSENKFYKQKLDVLTAQ